MVTIRVYCIRMGLIAVWRQQGVRAHARAQGRLGEDTPPAACGVAHIHHFVDRYGVAAHVRAWGHVSC